MASTPPSKFALETFLTGVKSSGAEFKGRMDRLGEEATQSTGSSVSESWRAVVLTVLDQNGQAVQEKDLLDFSELPPDKLQVTLSELQAGGLVVASDRGYELTDFGQQEAVKRRSRLLRGLR